MADLVGRDGHPRQCTATSKRSGVRCRRLAMKHQETCMVHGGKAPQNMAAAERRRQERDALLAVEAFGLPREVDPHTALLEELHRTAGAIAWLGAMVANLDHAVVGGSVLVELWQRERDHLVKVAKACVDVGIEERRVRLAEAAGAQLASVIRAVLDQLGLTAEQYELARTVVPAEFRRLGEVVDGQVVRGELE